MDRSAEINEGQNTMSLIMESSLDAIICMDRNGYITFWNKQAEKIFEWKRQEVIGKLLVETIIPLHYREGHRKGLHHYLMTGHGPALNKILEVMALNHKGVEFPIELTITPVNDKQQQFFCAFIRDITERKESEKKLTEIKERLERAEEQAKLGSLHVEIQSGKREWSKNMFRLFGFDPDKGMPDFQQSLGHFHPDDRPIIVEAYERIKQGQLPQVRIFRSNPALLPLRHFQPTWHLIRDKTGKAVEMDGTIMDITDRLNVENEIRSSELRYRSLIEQASDAIFITSEELKIIDANESASRLLGYSKEELTHLLVDDLVVEEEKHEIIPRVEELKRGREDLKERKLKRKDGTTVVTEVSSSVSKDGTMISFCRDISERKRAEEALRMAEERYHGIFENAFEGIFQSTPAGQFITVNPSMAVIFGYNSTEELVAEVTNISQLYLEAEASARLTDQLQKEATVIGYEFAGVKKNRKTIWVRGNFRNIYDREGKRKYLEGTLKDITEQKQILAQLVREKEFAESFLNSLPGVFYMYNTAGKFLRWNKNFETVTGYTSTEIAAMHPSEFFREGAERDLLISKIAEVFAKGFAEVEANFLLKDQTTIPYYFNGWKVDYENQICLIGVGLDISERKKGEEKSRTQYEELQRANQELDRFVYSASHDLRAPLASILGVINIAEQEHPPTEFLSYFGMIRNSINKLDGFINDILDYSYNSRQDLMIEKIDFQHILSEAQTNLKYIHGSQRLNVQLKAESASIFYTDRIRIRILVNNLISNAIRYQDFKKSSSFLTVHLVTSPEKVMITFSDNGIGIEAEHVGKVFDMFYRASHYSKGSGLGLYITKQAVNKLGGTIEVESEPGLSTTFRVNIPNYFSPA